MTTQQLEGYFWLPNRPEEQVPGWVTFGGSGPAELHLIGSLDSFFQVADASWKPVLINGVGTDWDIALYRCAPQFLSIGLDKLRRREQYSVSNVLLGVNFDNQRPLEFASVSVELQHLQEWVNQKGMTVQRTMDEQSNTIRELNVRYAPPETPQLATDIGEVQLDFPFTFTHGIGVDPSIEHSCALRLEFYRAASLDDCLRLCHSLQDLVTVGVNQVARIRKFSLTSSNAMDTRRDGRPRYKPIEVYGQWRGHNLERFVGEWSRAQIAFSFTSMKGLEGVARWLTLSEDYSSVMDSLLGHKYLPELYPINYFINMTVAAEALVRVRRYRGGKRGNVYLAEALDELADMNYDSLADLVGDVDRWKEIIVKTREANAIHRGLREHDQPDFLLLAESLYFLVLLCLLKEGGLPDGTLSEIRTSWTFGYLSDLMMSI